MPTSVHPPMQCALVGADSLLIECGEILRARGHAITAVAAGSPRVARWAHGLKIPVVDATAPAIQWQGDLAKHGFEWLFAITHLAILPDSVVNLATKGAVNFHDGPLPRYTGLNTPAWALLRGETEYGISWHAITAGVDEGPLYKQRMFEIADAETSLSLNTRNFEEAIDSFGELVDELAAGTATLTPQDPTIERNTFTRNDRPEALAVLDWRQSAATLERTIRALDFGRYPNPLGFAKLWNGTAAVLVTAAELVGDSSIWGGDLSDGVADPGQIVSLDDDRIVVGCGDGEIALSGFAGLTGQTRSAAQVATELGLAAGATLPGLDDGTRTTWTALGRMLAVAERAHLAELESLEPIEFPWAGTPEVAHRPRFTSVDVTVPAAIAGDTGAVAGAFAILLARLTGKDQFHIGLATDPAGGEFAAVAPFVAPATALPVAVASDVSVREAAAAIASRLGAARARAPFTHELIARTPDLAHVPELAAGRLLPIAVRLGATDTAPNPGTVVELRANGTGWQVVVDEQLVAPTDARLFVTCLDAVLAQLAGSPDTPVAAIDLLGPDLRRTVLQDWNDTAADLPGTTVHQLFEAQADRTPGATAVVFEDQSVTYAELDQRANRLAAQLIGLGVGPDALVGVHVNRGIDLLVSVLGVQKAGGAYVPLDPAYPHERLEHMIRDSGCRVVLTDAVAHATLPLRDDRAITVIEVDSARSAAGAPAAGRPGVVVQPGNLAYCIYTSGSTGMPKGVLIEHRNAVNFFVGMDERVPHDDAGTLLDAAAEAPGVAGVPNRGSTPERRGPGTWFAVTSLSFDISVLELLYTLTRGFTVVVYLDRDRADDDAGATPAAHGDGTFVEQHATTPIDFSLFYFNGDEAENAGPDKYRLLLDGARYADEHGFRAVWTPERHFHAFGGLYPNPAVTSAAVAAITKHVSIRAGSVVMPLHHPIRVAEAWSIVDNISNGRVAISIASGWQPNDFVLMPENFKNAKQAMFDGIDVVKRLWRGERVSFDGPTGKVEVTTLPRPVQPELPVWVTTAGNPETYIQAGKAGANVLTHLLGQTVEQLGPKIAAYRNARAEAGFDPDAGVISLMLHTFVGDDEDTVREIVREPLKQYLGTSFSLLKEFAWAFPAFHRPGGESESKSTGADSLADDDFKNLSAEDLDAVLEFAYLRYYESSGLFGTPERCREMVDRLKGIGVNEIACLVDFGVATDTVLASLPTLNEIREHSNARVGERPAPSATSDMVATRRSGGEARFGTPATPGASAAASSTVDQSVAAQLTRNNVTHVQCTPSMARMFSLQDDTREALANVEHLFIGGEAFPVALAKDLKALSRSGRITNMYGPTETTIWSTTWPLDGDIETIPIGTPIANTQIYILDKHRQPLPPGVAGELWIGGDGVVRGYHERPELTAERFVPDPFVGPAAAVGGARMYFTGDLARWKTTEDGAAIVEFLGRVDHQVKIRGYRIELGEIEAQLGTYPGVVECVVVVREDTPGDQQLVAYVSASADAIIDAAAVKARLRQHLPDVMVPAHIAVLDDLPHTPNGKIDRNRLPSLSEVLGSRVRSAAPVEASNDLERDVLAVWEQTLGTSGVGVDDNFFDIGGHSLLVVRMHRQLKEKLERPIALTDLYRYPTIRAFAGALATDTGAAVVQTAQDRAARRLARRARR